MTWVEVVCMLAVMVKLEQMVTAENAGQSVSPKVSWTGWPEEMENTVEHSRWGDHSTLEDEDSSACLLSLTLSKKQYKDLCPIREIANLRKQIAHVKRNMRNHTESYRISRYLAAALNESIQVRSQLQSESRQLKIQVGDLKSKVRYLEVKVRNLTEYKADKKEQPLSSVLTMGLYAQLQEQVTQLTEKMKHLEKIPIRKLFGYVIALHRFGGQYIGGHRLGNNALIPRQTAVQSLDRDCMSMLWTDRLQIHAPISTQIAGYGIDL